MPVFLNLKALLCRRFFLVPIAVSFAASVIGVTLIANVYAMREAKREQLNEDCRAYVVELREASTLEDALPVLRSRREVTRVKAAGRDGDTVFFANVYGEPPARRYMVSMGHYFETDSAESEAAQVILPTEVAAAKKLRVGDRYPLCGQDFTIIGIGFDYNGIEIPYAALKDRSGLFAVSVIVWRTERLWKTAANRRHRAAADRKPLLPCSLGFPVFGIKARRGITECRALLVWMGRSPRTEALFGVSALPPSGERRDMPSLFKRTIP